MIKSRIIIYQAIIFFTATCYVTALASGPGIRSVSPAQEEAGDHEEHGHEGQGDEPGAHDPHGEHEEEEKSGVVKLSQEAMQDFGITVEPAKPGTLEVHATMPGEVQVNQDRQAHIVPRYAGLVIDVRKTIGDKVKRGDVLAVLEGNESLAPYELKSLIDGTIIQKHITLGESLDADDAVFTIADLDTVWVDLTVYQKDIATVRPGQKVVISGGKHLPETKGTISYVSPTVDEHTRTGHARVVLPNPDGAWKPGLFVTGKIALDQVDADVVVPKTALQTLEGVHIVFIETAGGFKPSPVETGRHNHDHVEILSGLKHGERYVSRGGFTIKAEMARGELEHAGHGH